MKYNAKMSDESWTEKKSVPTVGDEMHVKRDGDKVKHK